MSTWEVVLHVEISLMSSYIFITLVKVRRVSFLFFFNRGEVAQGKKMRSIPVTIILSDGPLVFCYGLGFMWQSSLNSSGLTLVNFFNYIGMVLAGGSPRGLRFL